MENHGYHAAASHPVGTRSVTPANSPIFNLRHLHPSGSALKRPAVDTSDRNALFLEMLPLVKRLISRYGSTSELRQDLPGELYCLFHMFLDRYDPDRGVPLRAYLVRVLTAGAFTFARTYWRQNRRETSLSEGVVRNVPSLTLDPTPTWDARLQLRQIADTLPELMEHLPLRQRQVVLWRYIEDRSFDEIAQRLQIKPASARSLLRHGLKRLREQMAHVACLDDLP